MALQHWCSLVGEPLIVYGYVMNVVKDLKLHCGRISRVFLASKTNYIIGDYIVINAI